MEPAATPCSTSPRPTASSVRSSSSSAAQGSPGNRKEHGGGSWSRSRSGTVPSAKELNAGILKVLSEDQIYRIDHFLGKEPVRNIMVLRFANGIFEPLWRRDHIDHVQITVAETIGVEERGRFYERTGALRDMVRAICSSSWP